MRYQLTPAAERTLESASDWAGSDDSDELGTAAILLGLLAESECRAAVVLARHRIDSQHIRRQWPDLTERDAPAGPSLATEKNLSFDAEISLHAASQWLAAHGQPIELATEHVLLGLILAEHDVSAWLAEQGVDREALEAEIRRTWGVAPEADLSPLDYDDSAETALSDETPAAQIGTLRVLDAAANRAREGLRTVEDYVRFVLDDRHLTDRCKRMRHELAAALQKVPLENRLAARETQADVGTPLSTPAERSRQSAPDVLTAALIRLQEALRSLEEFGKLFDPDMAVRLKQLRYQSYTLHRAVETTRTSIERLDHARLYGLIDGGASCDELRRLAQSLIDAGVHVIQLRDKRLDDRSLLERARLLRELTAEGETLLIINDRPDLAALARADGVHVGQEELSVKDARSIVGPRALIGVSTHSIEQARAAVLDGANYIGVGPTFPSATKRFARFPGLKLLEEVATEIRLPAFAIGGITLENLPEVLATGISRVAISAALTESADPSKAVRDIRAKLAAR